MPSRPSKVLLRSLAGVIVLLSARPAMAIDIDAANRTVERGITILVVFATVAVIGSAIGIFGRGRRSRSGSGLRARPSIERRDATESVQVTYRDRYLPVDSPAAQALLTAAQDHHFSKRFHDARVIYQQIVDQHGDTKQAVVARQQLENLRNV